MSEGVAGGWPLFEGAHPGSEVALSSLDSMVSGSIVLWELMDRVVSDGFAAQDMIDLSDVVERHLAMTFHRPGQRQARLTLRINGRRTAPWDPFMLGHPARQWRRPSFGC